MFELMPVSIEFLRGILALIGIGCAYLLGRSIAGYRRGWQKRSSVVGWALRTTACLLAVTLRNPSTLVIAGVWIAAAALAVLGYRVMSRARKEEDLTDTIFPHEQ
jgi:predicted MFS family arabinose efflux permease